MIIPSEEGPNASVKASKETVPVNGQHLVQCTDEKFAHSPSISSCKLTVTGWAWDKSFEPILYDYKNNIQQTKDIKGQEDEAGFPADCFQRPAPTRLSSACITDNHH